MKEGEIFGVFALSKSASTDDSIEVIHLKKRERQPDTMCRFCGIGPLSHLNRGVCDTCHTIDSFVDVFARSARGRARLLEVLHTLAEVDALRESEGQ